LSKLGLASILAAGSALAGMAAYNANDVEMSRTPLEPVRPEAPPDAADTNYQFAADIGVKFNGVVRPLDVLAYNVAEGWIDCGRFTQINGKRIWRRERGVIMTYRLKGVVEPFWRR